MTTATATAWPTAETLEPAVAALANAHVETERVHKGLRDILKPYAEDDAVPETLPTAETVGVVWAFIETLRVNTTTLRELAESIERDLRDTEAMRRDEAFRTTMR